VIRWMRSGAGVALLVNSVGLAAERPADVTLVEVTSQSTAASQSVLITATERAVYTTRQPDPRTVLVSLRDVAAGDVASQLRPEPDDLVDALDVTDAVDVDGNRVAQVRIGLREPAVYEVRTRRRTIQVRFARPVGLRPATATVADVPSAPGEAVGPATAIVGVETDVRPDSVTVTLHGNGVLSPARILEAEHLPPRLVIDFPNLALEAPALTPVAIDPVRQVRVAPNSPEVTRVVLDLAHPAVYFIDEQDGLAQSIRVVFPRDQGVEFASAGLAGEWGEGTDYVHDVPPQTGSSHAWAAIPSSLGGVTALATVAATLPALAATDVPRVWAAIPSATGGVTALATVAATLPALAATDVPRVWAAIPSASGGVTALAAVAATLPALVATDVPRTWPEIPRWAGTGTGVNLSGTPPGQLEAWEPTIPDDSALVSASAVAAIETGRSPIERNPVAATLVPVTAVDPGPAPSEVSAIDLAASMPTQGDQFISQAGGGLSGGPTLIRVGAQFPGQPPGEQQEYTGDPISMDFQSADLRAVLRVFAEDNGLNIVIDPSVQGEVNVALTQVPWDQAFDIILRSNGLDYEVNGTVVRIASVQLLQQEAQDRALLAQREAEAGELVLFTRTLSYARAEDLTQLVRDTSLSQRGDVFTDPRTNTLIIRDIEDRMTSLSDLLNTLDRAEPQVEIEARIVQAGHDSARALGVQWGITGRVAQEIGNTLPFSFPNRGGITGRAGGPDGQGPSGLDSRALPDENAATAVNLGVGAATSALGLTMGSVNGALNLDIALSALESEGELSIISSPRVTTQNNVEASILQGDQIPYQTVANNTVTVQFKEAALTLLVTPQITNSNTVIMDVDLENSFADFGRALGDPPIPSIVTQRARTTIQVEDGQTTVIGGIYKNTQSERNDRTPVLNRIPLLGWLFRSTDRSEVADELMIFLTPRIVTP